MALTKIWSVLRYLVKNDYLSALEAKSIFDKIIEDTLYRTLNKKQPNLFYDDETPF